MIRRHENGGGHADSDVHDDGIRDTWPRGFSRWYRCFTGSAMFEEAAQDLEWLYDPRPDWLVQGKASRAVEVKMSAEEFTTLGFMMDAPGASAADITLDETIRQRVLWAFLQLKHQDLCKGLGLHWRAVAKRQIALRQPTDPLVGRHSSWLMMEITSCLATHARKIHIFAHCLDL